MPRGWRESLDDGNSFEALKAFLEEVPDDPDTEANLRALAEVQRDLRGKDFRRAKRALEQIEADFVDTEALARELDLLERSAKELDRVEPEAALQLLDEASHKLLAAEAETQRGTARVYMNETDKAREHFDKALVLDSRHYRAITNRGNLALEDGRFDEAIAAYEEALGINGDFANALHNLGVAYRRKGDVGKSIQKIKAAQRVSRQRDLEEARASVSPGRQGQVKWLRWALYGGAALGLYYLLQMQGII
jgi:tetratricopeptide (TPR) repeat protein